MFAAFSVSAVFPVFITVFQRLLVLFLASLILSACGEQLSAEDYLNKAQRFETEGQYNAALIAYKNSLQTEPENARVRRQLGELYLSLGQFASADKELGRAQQISPQDIEVLAARAKALLALERFQAVIDLPEVLTEIVSDKSDRAFDAREARASLAVSRGLAYLALKQPEAGKVAIDRAMQSVPDFEYGLYGLARWQLYHADLAAARQSLDHLFVINKENSQYWALAASIARLQGDYQLAEHALSQAINYARDPDQHRLARAMIRLRLEKTDAAAEDLANLGPEAKKLPGYHYTQGLLSTYRGDYETARLEFDQVLDTADDYLPALFYAGSAHYRTGHYELAREALARYVAKVPKDEEARRMLADIYLQQGDGARAQRLLLQLLKANPEDAQSLSLLAKTLLVSGNTQDAAVVLKSLTELQPRSADARLTLARVYLQQGQGALAVQTLETAKADGISHKQLNGLLIDSYLSAGMTDKALLRAQRVVEDTPSAASYQQLATTYLQAGQAEAASSTYQQVLALEPGNVDANLALAAMAIDDGEVERARGHLEDTLKHHPTDMKTLLGLADLQLAMADTEGFVQRLEQAVEAHPESLPPRLRLGWYYSRSGQPDKVRQLLGTFADTNPANPPLLQLLSSSAFQLQRYEEARDLIIRLIRIQPDNADVHYSLARVSAALGDRATFRRELKNTLNREPSHLRARVDLVGWLLETGALSEAEQQLDILLQYAPGSMSDSEQSATPMLNPAVVPRLQGRLAELQGQPKQAVGFYREVYRYSSAPVDLLRLSQALVAADALAESQDLLQQWLQQHPQDAMVRLQYAKNYLDADRQTDAVQAYERVLKETPDSPVALNNLAWLLRESNNARALKYAEQAEKQHPGSLDIKDTLAVVLFNEGGEPALRRARRLLDRILQERPDNAAALYHSAQVDLALGNAERARSSLQKSLASGAHFPEQSAAQALWATLAP